mgnify:CR=1 FL=1
MVSNKKSKQISVGFTARHREMIEEIMQNKGYPTVSSVVQQGIIALHASIFKDYVMVKQRPKVSSDDAKLPSKTDGQGPFKAICEQLEGKVVEKNGSFYCVYYTYNRRNRYQQEVPLDSLNESHVAKQYFPSKEDVKMLAKAGKVNY